MPQDDKIQLVLEAVERAKGAIDSTIKDINRLTDAQSKQAGVMGFLNRSLGDSDKFFRDIKIAAGLAAGAMALLVKHSIDAADALTKQARALETTTQQLAELNFAARLAVGGADELKVGLNQLARAIADSNDASTDSARLFKLLGIATKDAAGNLRGPVDVLFDVADAFQRTEGAAAKAAAAQALFGRGGRAFVDFLSQGSAAIKEQGSELEALGGVFGGDVGRKAESFNDNLIRLNEGIKGIATTALPVLLPPLVALTDAFVEIVKASNAAGDGTSTLIAVFKTLATIAIALMEGLRLLGIIIGSGLALQFENISILVKGNIELFAQLGQNIFLLVKSIGTLIGSLSGLGSVFAAIGKGDFVGAISAGKTALEGMVAAGADVSAQFVKIFKDVGDTQLQTVSKLANNFVSTTESAVSSISNLADQTKKLFDSLDADAQATKKSITDATAATGATPGKAGPDKTQLPTLEPLKPIQDRSKAQEELNIKLRETQFLVDTGGLTESQAITRNAALRQEAIAGIQKEKDALQARLDAAEGFTQQQTTQIEDKIAKLNDLQTQLQQQSQQAAFESSAAGGALDFANSLTGLQDSAKLTAGILQGTVGTAINGISSGIMGLIQGTTTWGQVFTQVGLQIVQALITIGLQILAQAIISAIAGTSVAEASAAAAVGVAGAWGAAAAAASIATYGAALAFGPLAALTVASTAGSVASIAGAFAAFAHGGLVPGTPSRRDNRLAAVATGEYIFDAASVQAVGPAFMAGLHHAIRQGDMGGFFAAGGRGHHATPSRAWGFAAGGLVGEATPPEAAQTNAVNVALVNTRNQIRDFQRSEGARLVVDALDARNNQVFS